MMKRGRGSILFIASMASLFGIPNLSAYAAAKTALAVDGGASIPKADGRTKA